MEYLAELFFVHSDFSLSQLLTNVFLQNHKNLYYVYMHAKSVLFCAYREKLDCKIKHPLLGCFISCTECETCEHLRGLLPIHEKGHDHLPGVHCESPIQVSPFGLASDFTSNTAVLESALKWSHLKMLKEKS